MPTKAISARWDFSRFGWGRVVVVTIVGTAGTMVVALLAASYTAQFMSDAARPLSIAAALLIPLFLSAPTFFYFASKLRELAVGYQRLSLLASQDSLTTCLNRGAFVALVEAHLARASAAESHIEGGMLMIDADHFKSINDRYGHSRGDDALRLIADCIRSAVRDTDILGRIGGEEFAVFLPSASLADARGDRQSRPGRRAQTPTSSRRGSSRRCR